MELRYFKIFLTIGTIILLFFASFLGIMRFGYNMIFIKANVIDALFVTGFIIFSMGLFKVLNTDQLFIGIRYTSRLWIKILKNEAKDNDEDNSYSAFKNKSLEKEKTIYWIAVLITGILIAVISMLI